MPDDGYNCRSIFLKIDLPNQKINKINGTHITGFTEVETFFVDSNPELIYLPIGLNLHFPHLKKIDIQISALKFISKNDFYGLNYLKTIQLVENQIETIPFDVFSTLYQLEQLNLQSNKIAKLHYKTFENLTNLEELHLQDNQIQELNEKLFINNLKLKNIYFNQNHLKSVGSKLVSTLINLSIIEFSGDENCINKDYNTESMLTIEKDLIAYCPVIVDTTENCKSNFTTTNISILKAELDNLNRELTQSKNNAKVKELELHKQMQRIKDDHRRAIDLLASSLRESETQHKEKKLLFQNLEFKFNNQTNEKQELTKKWQKLLQAFDKLKNDSNNAYYLCYQKNSQLKKEQNEIVGEHKESLIKIQKQLKQSQDQFIDLEIKKKNNDQEVVRLINVIKITTKDRDQIKMKLRTVEQNIVNRKKEDIVVVGKLNESLKIIQKQLNYSTNQFKDLEIKKLNLDKEIKSLKFHLTDLNNGHEINLQETMKKFYQTCQQNMTVLSNEIYLLNGKLLPDHQFELISTVIPTNNYEDNDGIAQKVSNVFHLLKGTLLLCSGCFNIFLIFLLILSIRSSKKPSDIVQNVETTFVMSEKRRSINYY